MKPPQSVNIVVTPVANCWLEGELLCVDNLNCRRTLENTADHYEILSSMIGSRKLAVLKEFPYCETFSAAAQVLAVTKLAPHCAALAIVTLPASVHSLVQSFRFFVKAGVPVKVFVQESEARRWLYLNS